MIFHAVVVIIVKDVEGICEMVYTFSVQSYWDSSIIWVVKRLLLEPRGEFV